MGVSVRRLALMLTLPLVLSGLFSGAALAATGPKNTSPPTISTLSGIQPSPGQTLVASTGTWTGKPPLAYTYEWYECDDTGANCVDTNASGSTYAVGDSDYAQDLAVRVTASNSAGQLSVMSAPVYIGPQPPQLLDPPTLSGGTQVGDTLTTTPGVWVTYPAYDAFYVWSDCDSSGANCTVTDPADSGPTYTLTAADLGYRVQVTVYVDDGDQASAMSDPTAVVSAASPPASTSSGSPGSTGGSPGGTAGGGSPISPAAVMIPQIVAAPKVSGLVRVGRTLSATTGSWSDGPTSYRYTWLDCGPNGACRQIKGAAASTYSLRDTDADCRIAVQVTASNGAGSSTPIRSALTATVPGPTAAALSNALTRLQPASGAVVLSHGGYTSTFAAPGAGTLTIVWTTTLGGRKLTLARFAARYPRSGTSHITIKLTSAGRKLLETERRLMVNARTSFAPVRQRITTQQHEFTLAT